MLPSPGSCVLGFGRAQAAPVPGTEPWEEVVAPVPCQHSKERCACWSGMGLVPLTGGQCRKSCATEQACSKPCLAGASPSQHHHKGWSVLGLAHPVGCQPTFLLSSLFPVALSWVLSCRCCPASGPLRWSGSSFPLLLCGSASAVCPDTAAHTDLHVSFQLSAPRAAPLSPQPRAGQETTEDASAAQPGSLSNGRLVSVWVSLELSGQPTSNGSTVCVLQS